MKFIFGNYGNDTVALIQWAFEQNLQDITVVSVETGFSAPSWPERVALCEAWVESLGYAVVRLKPPSDFAELIQAQEGFPVPRHQWCVSFLKAAPFLEYLDHMEFEHRQTATVILPHRRASSRARYHLPEWVEASPHFGQRRVWHPLFLHSLAERDALVLKSPQALLTHRSLECDPCINSDLSDVLRMDLSVLERTAQLEKQYQQTFLDEAMYSGKLDILSLAESLDQQDFQVQKKALPDEIFDMACGAPYGCGL